MSHFSITLCVIAVSFGANICTATKHGCNISLPDVIDEHDPLLISNRSAKLDIAFPKEQQINLGSKREFLLLCPGRRNSLQQSNANVTKTTCDGKGLLKIDGDSYEFKDLRCQSSPRAEIQETRIKCANDTGRIIGIGYKIDSADFLQVFRVCYNSTEGISIYTEHDLRVFDNDANLKYTRPGFSVAGLGPRISAAVSYKKSYQKSNLGHLLGSSTLAAKYIKDNSYLARGHLIPDADFFHVALRLATYFYINTCPQWQAVNNGNWKHVESTVRKFAEKYGKPLKIFTGTHGILSLPDVKNETREIFLVSGRKLPVPKYVWKLLHCPTSKKGIAIVVSNNPFLELPAEREICGNDCEEYGWGYKRFADASKGLVYCCEIDDFKKMIDVDLDVQVSSPLTGLD